MALLSGFRVVQLGPGLAAAVCGRLFAVVGARVACVDADSATPLAGYLNHGKVAGGTLDAADLIVVEGRPAELRVRGTISTVFAAVMPVLRWCSSRRSGRPGRRPMILRQT